MIGSAGSRPRAEAIARSSLIGSRSTISSAGPKRTGGTTIVDYLSSYQQMARPAPATYYRRFLLLRRFLRWVSRRDGAPDPFLDLEGPPRDRILGRCE